MKRRLDEALEETLSGKSDVATFLAARFASAKADTVAAGSDPDAALKRQKKQREHQRLAQDRPLPARFQLLKDMFRTLDQGVDISRGRGGRALMFKSLREYVQRALNRLVSVRFAARYRTRAR